MRSPPPELKALLERVVPVRVTDMRGFDMSRYLFDFDLTLAILLVHPDGRVLHRFGGRDHRGADRFVTVPGLCGAIEASLAAATTPDPIDAPARWTIEDMPSYGPWLEARGQEPECIHCHQVGEHEIRSVLARRERFDLEGIWRWPPPTRVGFDLDPDDQSRVVGVTADSPAAAAGLREGDRVLEVDGVSIATFTDVQFALEAARSHATEIALQVKRDGEERAITLEVPAGWKRGDALTFSWRPLKWGLPAGPGFGGHDIGAARKRALGLDPERHAFAISYFVTWGPFAHRGRSAARSLREGDVVHAVDGVTFRDQDHFHAWFRLHQKIGSEARVDVVRGGEKRTVTITVQP